MFPSVSTQNKEPQAYGRKIIEHTCVGPNLLLIFLIYAWGSVFGQQSPEVRNPVRVAYNNA